MQQRQCGISEVAQKLGLSETRVRQLDHLLEPIRDRNRRRVYDLDKVDRVAGDRDAQKTIARMKGGEQP